MGTSSDSIPWKTVNGTRGISKVVTSTASIDPSALHIEGLQQRCDEHSVFKSLQDITEGNRAKIERGPFAEFISTVDQIKDDQRAWVLIELLQQQTKVEVRLDSVSKIN